MATMTSHDFHILDANAYVRMATASTSIVAKHILQSLTTPTSTTYFPITTATSHILDAACGNGVVTCVFKSHFPFVKVTATDLAPGMITLMKELITENGWEASVDAKIMDVRDLNGLEDEEFSHVVTNFGFAPDVTDLEGPGKAAREMWRVLRRGGVAVVSTWAGEFGPTSFYTCWFVSLFNLCTSC